MLSILRRCLGALAISLAITSAAQAQLPALGAIANQQARRLATLYPGRMTGSPAEILAADFIHQRLQQWGYQSDIRRFLARYAYQGPGPRQTWRSVTGSSVIAAREGREPKQIVIVAHLDTYAAQSERDDAANLGGLTLQGMDDNAVGVGVLLELAARFQAIPTRYTLRFITTSGEEEGQLGANNILQYMDLQQQKNTLLVINLDELVGGTRLYFTSGLHTPAAERKRTRDRALALARRYGIPASTPPAKAQHALDNSDAQPFDQAGLPVLNVNATDWALGNKDGVQQRAKSRAFPDGIVRHYAQRDSQQYLDTQLPGRIAQRCQQTVQILLPLIKSLAQAERT